MREVKFRWWRDGRMWSEYDGWCEGIGINEAISVGTKEYGNPIMQFTGLKDKNGVEIFEGDILLHRRPARSHQDHYGPNIPGPSGHYREPLEPEIAKEYLKVYFRDGCFMVRDDCPLMWLPNIYSREEAMDGFEVDTKYWNDAEEGDLAYLLAEYGFDSESAMIESLGSAVIGNIHENPELLEQKA
jgi:hypothetical protein